MRFVVDENVSLSVVRELEAAGHAVVSVAKEATSLRDEDVYAMAVAQKAILITRDHHFANPIRFPSGKAGGIIYIRHGKLTSEEEASLVLNFLGNTDFRAIRGCLVTISKGRVSIRPARQY
ncbi:MAG: DUF5615 family PIN-like protein [Moorellales bacterium]